MITRRIFVQIPERLLEYSEINKNATSITTCGNLLENIRKQTV
jgi:hypothetical protein